MRHRHRPVFTRGLPTPRDHRNLVGPTLRHKETTMTPDTSRWRSSEAYDYLDSLDSPDLAWEWLRRNPEYQKDYARADSSTAKRELHSKWGLHFFRPAVVECWRGPRVLVRRGGHERRVAHRDAHRSADGRQSLFRVARASRSLGRSRRPLPARDRRPNHSPGPACWGNEWHATRSTRAA